jgi:hypothetical protein
MEDEREGREGGRTRRLHRRMRCQRQNRRGGDETRGESEEVELCGFSIIGSGRRKDDAGKIDPATLNC